MSLAQHYIQEAQVRRNNEYIYRRQELQTAANLVMARVADPLLDQPAVIHKLCEASKTSERARYIIRTMRRAGFTVQLTRIEAACGLDGRQYHFILIVSEG